MFVSAFFVITMLFVLSSSSAFMFAKTPVHSYLNIGIQRLRHYRHCKSSVQCELSSSTNTATAEEDESPSTAPRYMDHHMPFFPIYYNDVYEVDLPQGHRFPMEKYRKVRMALQDKISTIDDEHKNVKCEFHKSPLATTQQLSTTHDSTYITRYLTGNLTERENRNIGFPWSEQHVNRSLSSVGGTVHAALSCWAEYVRRKGVELSSKDTSSLCWGAHVAGGTHHAFSDYGEGFCIFSDIAVAANVLLETYGEQSRQAFDNSPSTIRRILIIDLDVHQGNGNAALFQQNDKVKTFSMHCVGNYFSRRESSDLDVELPVGCDDETYLSTLSYWLRRIENHNFDDEEGQDMKRKQFDVIFYQAGVDIHHADRLGKLSVTQEGISRRNSLVFEFARKMDSPLVISMGGGYPNGNDWTPILEAHTNVYWEAYRFLSATKG